MKEKILKY